MARESLVGSGLVPFIWTIGFHEQVIYLIKKQNKKQLRALASQSEAFVEFCSLLSSSLILTHSAI